MRNVKKWTDAEKSLARQMSLLGHSHSVIGARLGRTKKSVQCFFASERRPEGGPCVGCGSGLHQKNTTGYCRPCFARKNAGDPLIRAKIARAYSEHAKRNPQAVRERARKAAATKKANPELIARLAETMRQQVQPKSCTPEAIARRDLHARGRKISATKLAWCPVEYRPLYTALMRDHGLKRAEAWEIVKKQMAADRTRLASLSPFERQERALANGAHLVANDQKPSLARPGVYRAEDAA